MSQWEETGLPGTMDDVYGMVGKPRETESEVGSKPERDDGPSAGAPRGFSPLKPIFRID